MKTSRSGVDLIKSLEGLRLTSYLDSVGVPTIGYGHTGPDIALGQKIDHQHAEVVLRKDLIRFENAVKESVKIELNQHQFDALVSFAFNVGVNAFKDSTLLRRLNNKEDPSTVAKQELPRWNKGLNNKVLEGLTRRRIREVELFCSPLPKAKTGTVTIRSRRHTMLKKQPVMAAELKPNEKAKIIQNRVIPNCTILDRKGNHTLIELGHGMGQWWVYDAHWDGLYELPNVGPYATDGELTYLRNFPYFYQVDNGPEGWRQCQTSAVAMCLKYIDVPGINDDLDYGKYVNKYGDTTHRAPHFEAMEDLGVTAKFTMSADSTDVKNEILKGRPVVAGILHHGPVDAPRGGGHFIVITGFGKDYWLVQDPFGCLDLVNGGWAKTGSTAGKNQRYSFKNMDPRFFYGGHSNGWCWLEFKKVQK